MEESGGRLKLFKDDADAKAAYQEALEEVDLDKAWQQGYKTAEAEYQEKLNQMRLERPAFKKHEIENLLSQSNADGYKRGFEQGLIAQNCWISLKDKSPEINQRVLLATNEKRSIVTGCRLAPAGKNEPWFHTDLGLWCGTETVTHWQELPEPPKEEE
jgi:hypothetical protein